MVLGKSNVIATTGINSAVINPALGADCVLQSIYASYISSASAGNRQIYLDVLSGATVIFRGIALSTQAAFLTYQYNAIPAVPNESHTTWFQICLPHDFILKNGWTIKVYDQANIDNAGDAITTQMLFRALG